MIATAFAHSYIDVKKTSKGRPRKQTILGGGGGRIQSFKIKNKSERVEKSSAQFNPFPAVLRSLYRKLEKTENLSRKKT